jgi:hypothetical protein
LNKEGRKAGRQEKMGSEGIPDFLLSSSITLHSMI